MDDMSTIGDPAFFTTADSRKETMTQGGYSVDYDYTPNREALSTVSSVDATGTKTSFGTMITTTDFLTTNTKTTNNSIPQSPNNNSSSSIIFSSGEDDSSFEKQFMNINDILQESASKAMVIEVDAPSGKLGLIIDTPNGGIPMVQAMKNDSVLYTKVKVGDLLVSVDSIDTRRMSASIISQLISINKSNPCRKLVFVRNNHWL